MTIDIPSWLSPAMTRTHIRAVESLHPVLRALFREASATLCDDDVFWYCYTGYRGPASQKAAFESGRSRARYGQSWHNVRPALAFDAVPVWSDNPSVIEWTTERTKRFLQQAGSMEYWTWGGDFSRLRDMVHFQLLPAARPPEDMLDYVISYNLEVLPLQPTNAREDRWA